MEIEGITLWLFGGVAQFKGAFPNAGAEFRVAIAGPLVSLGLGIFFVLLAVFAGLPNAVDGVVAWLGYINLHPARVQPVAGPAAGRRSRAPLGAVVLQG